SWLSWSCETAPTYWVRPVDEVVVAHAASDATITSAAMVCLMYATPAVRRECGGGCLKVSSTFRRHGGRRGCAGSAACDSSGPVVPTGPGATRLDVEVRRLERIVLDECATRFHHVAHQGTEDLVGGNRILDPHLQQAPGLGIDRGVPELLGVHLAQALEALDLATLLGL